ncbi:MAG TPA: amidase, partial [Geminicoccaceae bacterium]|nr:amidase [Geminicoccaceae bacterium]
AAVAAGLCPFSLGTDTAGSIRIPAAWNGVAGLKPTYGRVSIHNVVAQSFTADHAGPLARSVADLALVLQAIAGFDPRDPEASREPVPDYAAALEGGVGGLRIGVPRELLALGMEPAVEGALDAARRVLQELGCEVDGISVPLLAEATPINKTVIMAETTARHDEWAGTWFAGRERVYGADVAEWLEIGRTIPAPDFVRASRRRRRLADDLRAALTRVDLLLVPTAPCVAPPFGASTVRLGGRDVGLLDVAIHFLCAFSLAGLPALSVPAGFDPASGLPVGIQLVGRAFDEANVLRAGHAFERATGHHRRHPDLG